MKQKPFHFLVKLVLFKVSFFMYEKSLLIKNRPNFCWHCITPFQKTSKFSLNLFIFGQKSIYIFAYPPIRNFKIYNQYYHIPIGEDTMSFKRLLHRMWFALYPRSRRTKGSCAFEHVFLGEVKNGKVNGFHNWLFFLLEEQKGMLCF